MHNFVKLALVLPVICLCACAKGINISFEKSEYGTEKQSAAFNLPVIDYPQNQAFAESVSEEFKREASLILEDFLAREEPSLKADTEITHRDQRLVSLVLEGEVDTGKAHGEKFRRTGTYDFMTQKKLKLSDLFQDEAWKQAVDNKMKALAESDEGDYEDLWEMPSVELLQAENFYIKDGKLVLYFPPYELSYYRRGYVEFEFEKEELSGYLSELGRAVL